MRFPVTSGYGHELAMLLLYNNLGLENIIRESEGVGVQVEVAKLRGIVASLVTLPGHILDRRGRNAVLVGARVIVLRRCGPEITGIRLFRVADISWLAPKCQFGLGLEC